MFFYVHFSLVRKALITLRSLLQSSIVTVENISTSFTIVVVVVVTVMTGGTIAIHIPVTLAHTITAMITCVIAVCVLCMLVSATVWYSFLSYSCSYCPYS